MKRNFPTNLSAIILSMMFGLQALAPVSAARNEAPKLGRYDCASVAGGSALSSLKLLTVDKYESAGETGVYSYEAGSGKIEWLTGPIPKQQLGFYRPRGVDNATDDTIIIRDKKDVEGGIERDLLRCSLVD